MAFEALDPDFSTKVCEMYGQLLLYGDFKTPFDCVAGFYVLHHAEKCDDNYKIAYCAIDDKLLKEETLRNFAKTDRNFAETLKDNNVPDWL